MRASPPPQSDLSGVSTEELMKMRTQAKPGVTEDVVKTLPGIVPRAAGAVVGMPQSIMQLGMMGARKIGDMLGADTKYAHPTFGNLGGVVEKGYDSISELVTGKPVYKPQTGPGRIVDTTGQVLVSGPGSIPQKATIGAASGVSGEAARQFTNNPILIGLAQMLGGGLASIPFIVRSVPAENINSAIAGIDEQHLAKAQKLMDDAAKMGTPLTGAEAIAQVTGKNNLQDIQRVIEGSKQSSGIIQPTMNARPEANQAAFQKVGDTIAATVPNPSATPVRLQEAAQSAITKARQAGNAAAKPSYDAAATQKIPPQEWNNLTQDPMVQKAIQAVKSDPMWGVANEVEGSVRWLDAAKRWIDDAKIKAGPNEARILDGANTRIKTIADAASPDYAQARAIVAQNRQQVVKPMENSPVGDIARTGGPAGGPRPSGETMMVQQSNVLMPSSPRALDPLTIHSTVNTLSKQDPRVAAQWTRQNLEGIFNEATQANVGGANQWGGAKFASQVAGNQSQRDNLQALVEATSGKQAWNGFNRMLEVMEAQGKRLAPGSNTARDIRTGENLSGAGIGGAPAVAASPTAAMNVVYNWYQNFRYGKNTAEMARILTDPKSVDLMKQLAKEAPTSSKATALTAQIVAAEPIENADR